MNNKVIYFLGEEYTIPSQLRDFVCYLNESEHILNNDLMPLLLNQMKDKSYCDGGNSFTYYKSPLVIVGEKYIKKLSKNKVYDITIDDLVYNNQGYINLQKVCCETLERMKQILINSINEWEAGYNNAHSSATSNITGMGFSIWTNSLSSALLYTAMEASTLKKQTSIANKQYRDAISSLNKKTNNKMEQQEAELLANFYYPKVAESLSLFVSTLIETYLSKLAQHGQFDLETIKKYDLARSCGIIKNIKLVDDKEKLIKQAFSICPYNPDVYQALLDNNLVDYDTFETAKYLLQDKILADRIMSYCTKNSDNINKISIAIKIYSSYTDKNDNEIIELIYKDKLKIVRKHFEELRLALSSEYELSNWIYKYINRNAVVFSKREKSDLHNSIKNTIKRAGLKRDTILKFIDINILSLSELTGSQYNAKNLDDVFNYFISNMEKAINEYLEKIIKHVMYCNEKSEQLKIRYEKEQKLYNDRIKELEKQESSLRTERNSLGLFAFSKKKLLDEKISNCIQAKEEFTKNHSPESIKLEYETYLEKSIQYV